MHWHYVCFSTQILFWKASFSWGIFSHVMHLDQSCTSKNNNLMTYNCSYSMMAKPTKIIEFHYPMIQLLIIVIFLFSKTDWWFKLKGIVSRLFILVRQSFVLFCFAVGEKFRWFFENVDEEKTQYTSSEVCTLIERYLLSCIWKKTFFTWNFVVNTITGPCVLQ